jgi:hypothetical protein
MKKLAILCVVMAGAVGAQTLSHRINLPADSPVALLSADFSNSTTTARGGTYLVDVRAALSLRNSTQKTIRAVTLAVYAQEVAPGGKGSVSVPSLNVTPGETFKVNIAVPLLRPLGPANAAAPSVEVKLDGVLFDDLSFFGPDTLKSQYAMLRWEMEARRDRKYFKTLLETAGVEAVRKEMIAGLARQDDRRRPGAQMARGRATNTEAEREMQFAFVEIPESPVEALAGSARVALNEARAPRISVRNRSTRPVDHLEIGWIVRDQLGREFLAASMPADLKLAPNQSGDVREEAALRLQDPVAIQTMTGFVSSVSFADGSLWIPSRSALAIPRLREVMPPSPEEQRLLQIYSKKGLGVLIEELKKF